MAVNAKGDVLVELRIFKDPANAKNDKITLGGMRTGEREEWPVYYAVTKNGYMDSTLWLDLMHRVVERHELFYPGLKPVLLLDHHTTHEQHSALQFLVNQMWKFLFFPSHTTHFLQPLDNVCFARFKFEIAAGVRRLTFRDALNRHLKNARCIHDWCSNKGFVLERRYCGIVPQYWPAPVPSSCSTMSFVRFGSFSKYCVMQYVNWAWYNPIDLGLLPWRADRKTGPDSRARNDSPQHQYSKRSISSDNANQEENCAKCTGEKRHVHGGGNVGF